MKKKRVYVVPHSHWDREWYFTIEDSNVLLAENLDHLMDVLENDPDYMGYVFDAQASLVEEYLKVRPDQMERLKSLIEAKRIFVGPWYTQTDSLLVHKESVIRNLLYGTRICQDMGHSMGVGYLPDIFGQNAYLPSIFQGFDIDYSVLQRGIYTDQLNGDLNFMWTSPDGNSVKANNIYFGYGPGKFLEASDEYMEERLMPMLEKLADLNTNTDSLLLPAGGDQVLVREHFPATVAELNRKDDEHEYILSDYETFMKETWSLDGEKFENKIDGELMATQKSRIHSTIRSQRYDIKELNARVENKILNVLEPLAVIALSLGLKYPGTWLDQMWKALFDVHAHDSIGGCNSDDTNADIMHRLEKVNRTADGLLNILKKQMTEAVSRKLSKDNVLVLFNTKPQRTTETIETVIFTKAEQFAIRNLTGEEMECELLDQEYVSGGKKIVVTAEGEKEVEVPGYYRSVVSVKAVDLPAMGYAVYEVVEGEKMAHKLAGANDNSIANELFDLSLADGQLSLFHKPSGKVLTNFLTFENVADAGDSYDFSPMAGDSELILDHAELLSVEKGSFTEKMTVRHLMDVPADLAEREANENSGRLEIVTTIELRKGEEFLRVAHEIDNEVKDHRVRALLKTPVIKPETSFADQGFTVLERRTENPYLQDWREKGFAEAPVPIYPMENFAGVRSGEGTLGVMTKGLKEYEVLAETSELAVTLFRSVGLLGRDDLIWRPGRASGINNKVVYTPDAQMQKKMIFEYAVYFSDEKAESEYMFRMTDSYLARHAAYQKQSLNTFEERLERFEIPYPVKEMDASYSLFETSNPAIFMSVCKRAYEDSSIIVRLFNPGEQMERTMVESPFGMVETNLYERELQPVKGEVKIPAKGYVTLKLTKRDVAE
ncbi:glycoside hydrolase family 38 N-terminal domain-containing protein [Falsibacillus albus]|uniref:Alpha-mannosidase n=1 Tax=Falsibacillus albus TaxID=2478915 RepID=A0A3L7JVX1_9BACI|nr:glycoside hydrolase family 38 C-terminal domain-containing protein [Falsibacillus albus]RLQ94896.1 alpha-mannosidase [Falsibacillus albus]